MPPPWGWAACWPPPCCPPACCANTGTPAKASGNFTLNGLSVLFSISTLPCVESLGMNFTPRSPLAMPSNRSMVVALGSSGALRVMNLLGSSAAHSAAGIAAHNTTKPTPNHCRTPL